MRWLLCPHGGCAQGHGIVCETACLVPTSAREVCVVFCPLARPNPLAWNTFERQFKEYH